jgi:dipeptidyl-peptidase 4
MSKIIIFSFVLIFTVSLNTFGEGGNNSELTLDRIYTKKEFTQPKLGKTQWFENGNSYTMLERVKGVGQNIVKYDTETDVKDILISVKNLIPKNSSRPINIYDYEFSSDLRLLLIFTNTKKVWRTNTRGDYWILNRETNELKKLGQGAKPSTLMFATLSPDNKHVAYVRENNLYVESIYNEEINQLTVDGSTTIINGTFDWVYEEELDLQNGFRWSPDSKRIAYWQIDAEGIGVFNMINNTDSIYSKIIPVQYPKVGTQNSACKIGVVEIASKNTEWFKIPGDPRNNYIARMDWAESSEEAIIQQLNRLQNSNKVYIGSARTGEVRNNFADKDEAWVDVVDDVKWFKNGQYFTWISEKDGWRHVYLISRDGSEVNKITPGNYDVIKIVGIDQTDNYLYFIASPHNPTQKYLFRKSIFSDDEKELLTPIEIGGTSAYDISPNFRWAKHTHSSATSPTQINLISLPDHKIVRNLQSNIELKEKLAQLDLNDPEFFRVDIGSGVELDGWKIIPPDFDETNKYPVLFFVYGEPGSQRVLDKWMRRGLWHQMLAQKGYIVMCIDNRGTPSPRGRDFRKSIYGQVGILASADQADATRVISEWDYVDKTRIGIWGWSGGGSMSLNAIFRYPELYKTAIAVAPVGDQKLYDTIYQERFMGLPSTNPAGYKNGSPVNFAHQLEGNLLLIHGTGDDNVHYQNTEIVINELIKHNKIFSVMPYPNRSHSISEGINTYRHVHEIMLNYLENNL